MQKQDCVQLTLFQADSHASHFPSQEDGAEETMTASSGRKLCALCRKSGPLGLLAKTLLVSSARQSRLVNLKWKAEQLTDYRTRTTMKQYYHSKSECLSSTSSATLNVSATLSKHLLFRLAVSARGTGGKESQLWATPNTMDALPQRSYDAMKRQATNGGRKNHKRPGNLREQVDPLMCQAYDDARKEANVRMWPTPTQREWKGGRSPEALRAAGRTPTNSLCDTINALEEESDGKLLNPDWVEWLMGLPVGWTSIDADVPHTVPCDYWDAEPDIPRVSGSTPHRADRIKCLGNMVVPQQFHPIFAGIAEIETKRKTEG